jgi:hypothetical protein
MNPVWWSMMLFFCIGTALGVYYNDWPIVTVTDGITILAMVIVTFAESRL